MYLSTYFKVALLVTHILTCTFYYDNVLRSCKINIYLQVSYVHTLQVANEFKVKNFEKRPSLRAVSAIQIIS